MVVDGGAAGLVVISLGVGDDDGVNVVVVSIADGS